MDTTTGAAQALTAAEAEELTQAIRTDLAGAVVRLRAARDRAAHTALGYPSWHGYVEDRLGDLLAQLRLPVTERRALVASLAATGEHSMRDIAARLGVSSSTVKNDVHALEEAGQLDRPDRVVSRDGTLRAATGRRAVAYVPEPGMSRRAEAVARTAHAGPDGLTCLELERDTGWRHGVASSPMSWARRTGRVTGTGVLREGYEVYVVVAPQ